jgi:hypothetical protein
VELDDIVEIDAGWKAGNANLLSARGSSLLQISEGIRNGKLEQAYL